MTEINNTKENLIATYGSTCDFFMVNKNDEKREKSDKFFEYFWDFILLVHKELPKPKSKKQQL